MRIAMIGNINNASFLLGEGLRELGADVRLLVTRNEKLHHPVQAGLVDALPQWVRDGSSIGLAAYESQDPSIAGPLDWVMQDAELAILNDTGPSLHNLLHVPVVSFLTGSDLSYYGALDSARARRAEWDSGFVSTVSGLRDVGAWEQMVVRQRAGIRRSAVVNHANRGLLPAGDTLLDEIGVADDRRVSLLNIDVPRVRPTPAPPGQRLRIFNGARLNWVDPLPLGFSDQDHKGTDLLLLGFAKFLQRGGEGQLTLVEKGLHVAETRELARDLGIGPHVIWKAEMTMSEFYAEMEASHVICDNLGRSVPGQAGLSGMAAGRPVLANFAPYEGHFAETWPVCHARTADEVAEHLWILFGQPEQRSRLGAAARRFAEANLSPVSAARILLDKLAEFLPMAAREKEIRDARA